MDRWKTRLEALGLVAGTAALIQFVGGAVMYLRFEDTDVPPAQTVAALPNELLFVVGARSIVPLLLVGAVAVAFLYAVAGHPQAPAVPLPAAPTERARLEQFDGALGVGPPARSWRLTETPSSAALNPADDLPPTFDSILFVLLAAGAAILAVSGLGGGHIVFLGLFGLLILGAARYATKASTSLATGGWAIFFVTATFGTALALAKTIDSPVKLDLGAVETVKGKTRIGGFFLARTDKSVYLVTRPAKGTHGPQVTVIDTDNVGKLKYGPRGIEVNKDGYDKGDRLAERLDSAPPKLTVTVARTQRIAAGGGVTLTASCNEPCRLRVTGFAVGTGLKALRFEPVSRKLPARVTAHVKLSKAAGNVSVSAYMRKHPRLRARLRIAVRDAGGNRTSVGKHIRLSR